MQACKKKVVGACPSTDFKMAGPKYVVAQSRNKKSLNKNYSLNTQTQDHSCTPKNQT